MMLRDFLNKLDEENKLIRINKEVSNLYEISNIIYSNNENTTGSETNFFTSS